MLPVIHRYSIRHANLLMGVPVVYNILLPLLVVMVVSPYCFFNVFVSAPAVTTEYPVAFCDNFVYSSGVCIHSLLRFLQRLMTNVHYYLLFSTAI